jgi:hypothetical protein
MTATNEAYSPQGPFAIMRGPFFFEGSQIWIIRGEGGPLREEKIEMRGVFLDEILSYFRETGWQEVSPGLWRGKCGSVEAGLQEEVSLGSVRLPSVTLVFRLRRRDHEKVLSSFRSRFLKAGG